ncbi:protocadherin Fat 1-like [Mercenaria mercenaria]|uniref:protocadherin Fat 1-like n=1 Tax=Mercenaria mercenaria TaxID=6596 RepID=UPI00234FA336|nr:protocadherin Fat 1-like [Mercenaria mercenaria]
MCFYTTVDASVTIDSSTTNISDIIYTATVSDDEGDPITMSLICDPTACPFAINNNGEITITSDPSLLTQTTYTFILTADDGFSTVTSSNISVTITNINVKPVITNLPAPTQTVLENQAAGTLVFQVSQSDANGDTPTFYATFSSTACAGMYDVNSTDGSVTTLASLDYETDTSCTLTITVSDGVATSDPETLTIDVGDEDEPPIFTSNAYVITTEEVADGTTLPDVGISATDPEGTAVSLSLNCAYVDIDSVSGIVTMTTNYDIETSATNPYTIACIVTATDATSQTSTATLDVIISDGNDNAPVFTEAIYTSYIAEGHTGYGIIENVIAADADRTSPNNVITFSMTPTTSFSIGGSGEIQNIVDLSGDTAGTTYTLTVTATDGGSPSLSSTATVIISVLTTTTTTTTMAATTTSGSGLFSDTANIVLFALAVFAAALLSVLVALFIWRYCCRQRLIGKTSCISRIGPKENNLRDSFKGHSESGSTNNLRSPSPRNVTPSHHNDVYINHVSEDTPRYKGDNYVMTPRWLEKQFMK